MPAPTPSTSPRSSGSRKWGSASAPTETGCGFSSYKRKIKNVLDKQYP